MPLVIGSGITIGPGITLGESLGAAATTVITSFTSNGTFSVPSGRTIASARMLLVAGGGAGGNPVSSLAYGTGGGGGAGGLIANVDLTGAIAVNTNYTIVIGAGGAVPTVGNTSNGANSTAFGYTAIGGGGGGSAGNIGVNGGSGGGAFGNTATDTTGGNSIQSSSFGYGVGFPGSINLNVGTDQHSGGAGGGAGGAGTAATGSPPTTRTLSVGGIGIYDNISGSNTYYAEGGSGFYQRANGSDVNVGVQSATLGGGGGGGFNTANASAGQSGICIISYSYF